MNYLIVVVAFFAVAGSAALAQTDQTPYRDFLPIELFSEFPEARETFIAEKKTPDEQMRWLDDVSADQQFVADRKAGRHRLLQICGYACEVPYRRELLSLPCSIAYEVTYIEGTTDGIWNDEHMRLNGVAVLFARRYNRMMTDYLRNLSQTNCE